MRKTEREKVGPGSYSFDKAQIENNEGKMMLDLDNNRVELQCPLVDEL